MVKQPHYLHEKNNYNTNIILYGTKNSRTRKVRIGTSNEKSSFWHRRIQNQYRDAYFY